ncbi:hypothetical protein A2U01_0066297, partial [Trifolium medium]|nr:hypothetical protein [Trifolium medium]
TTWQATGNPHTQSRGTGDMASDIAISAFLPIELGFAD